MAWRYLALWRGLDMHHHVLYLRSIRLDVCSDPLVVNSGLRNRPRVRCVLPGVFYACRLFTLGRASRSRQTTKQRGKAPSEAHFGAKKAQVLLDS